MTHVTKEFHRVRPKRFLSLWYLWRKPCTYLAPTPTLSPNEPKRDSTLSTSPWSSIAPILHRHWLPTDKNKTPHDPRHLGVPSGASKSISKPMVCSAPTVHLSCTNTGSQQTETRFHRSTSPRSTIGCVQNDFRAYGMFGANRAPILHRHWLPMD